MDTTHAYNLRMAEQDRNITEAVSRERGRLRSFIRRRVSDHGDAKDIFARGLLRGDASVSDARTHRANRRMDVSRRAESHHGFIPKEKTRIAGADFSGHDEDLVLDDFLPAANGDPDAEYARGRLLQTLSDAVAELPEEQRAVFIAHELEGVSFKELAQQNGASLNTLLARKRYAVLQLRKRLQTVYDEL